MFGSRLFWWISIEKLKNKIKFIQFALHSLNKNILPNYLKCAKLILLSKTGSGEATLNNIRPIMVLSHIKKIFEKAIKIN